MKLFGTAFKKGKIRKLQQLNRNQANTIMELEEKSDSEYVRGVMDGMKAHNSKELYAVNPEDGFKICLSGIKRGDAFTIPFNEKYIVVELKKGYLRWKYINLPKGT
jgi:hypothetical protein